MGALIAVTQIQTFFPFVAMRPLNEYRKPTPPPDIIRKIIHGDGRVATDVNTWFDDRMGFRAFLTRLVNQIDYSFFGYSKRVLIGKNGWLFDFDVFRAAINASRSSDGLATERNKMVSVAQFLKSKDIQLVIISTPAKETIYREFLPASAPQGPVTSEFEKFRAYLKAGDGREWIYIDSQDILMRAKSNEVDLYFRTDLHMTSFGNILIAKELVNRLAEAERLEWRWNPRLDLASYKQGNGSNLRFLSVFSDLTETILEPKPDVRYGPNNPPPGGSFEGSPARPFEMIFHNEAGHSTIPRAVLFGSSFVDRFAMLGAFSYFKDLYRVRGVGNEIGSALKAIPPGTRYFIFQFWEPHLSLLRHAQIPHE